MTKTRLGYALRIASGGWESARRVGGSPWLRMRVAGYLFWRVISDAAARDRERARQRREETHHS